MPIHLVSKNYFLESCSPLPEALAQELRDLALQYFANGFPADGSPCIWYDAEMKQCRHYEHRPTLCRDAVAVGDVSCLRWRRSKGIDPKTTWTIRRGEVVRDVT